jgi:hypothetical protein
MPLAPTEASDSMQLSSSQGGLVNWEKRWTSGYAIPASTGTTAPVIDKQPSLAYVEVLFM